jgi:2'-5' RNA ligase
MNSDPIRRTFIGIPVPKDPVLLGVLSQLVKEFEEEKFRWNNPGGYHITLKFIGPTLPSEVQGISLLLRKVCQDYQGFSITLKGLGLFRSLKNPRVLWISPESSAALQVLQTRVSKEINSYYPKKAPESFNPHVTIARMKKVKDADRMIKNLEKYREYEFMTFRAGEVIFYESITGRTGGAVYNPIEVFPLG